MKHIYKALRMARVKGITQFYLPSARSSTSEKSHSAFTPDGAIPDRGSRHLIAAYYSFSNPERMKG